MLNPDLIYGVTSKHEASFQPASDQIHYPSLNYLLECCPYLLHTH